ncbi:hypothetical protein [Streptomyces sp. NPDC059761]|uniref:hypothetical protein n=1 Tax=unclassified Streptomyces TaxID=2593676 RepID=UPI0036540DEF
MKLRQAATFLATAALTATTLLGISTSANAASWNCWASTGTGEQSAVGFCEGNGPMRVAVYCDSDRYPYRTTLYGPWDANMSAIEVHNCYISKAWVDVA